MMRRRTTLLVLVALTLGIFIIGGFVVASRSGQDSAAAPSPSSGSSTETLPVEDSPEAVPPVATSSFNKKAQSLTDPASYWVVANKLRPLSPKSYAAKDLISVPVAHVYAPVLRKKASDAVVTMFAAYNKQTGKKMQSQSAYRSYPAQVTTYNGWVSKLGKAGADLTSARPGYSEHQTGLAIDISASPSKCALQACFASTNQGKWLAANAYKYGFILRYPKGKTAVTGYEFEPWHYRYVGVSLATEMKKQKVATMEEFFGLPAAEDYAK